MASGLHGDIEVAAVPVHEEEDGRAGPDAGELPLEVVHALHGLLIDLGDHVAGLDAGARGGTAVLHAAHQDSCCAGRPSCAASSRVTVCTAMPSEGLPPVW